MRVLWVDSLDGGGCDSASAIKVVFPSRAPADECGIVAQVSAPLAQADISTYYISTYNTDNTLVSVQAVDPMTCSGITAMTIIPFVTAQ